MSVTLHMPSEAEQNLKTVADRFAETLVIAGVRRTYGMVSDSLTGLTDAIRRQGKIEWIHVRPSFTGEQRLSNVVYPVFHRHQRSLPDERGIIAAGILVVSAILKLAAARQEN